MGATKEKLPRQRQRLAAKPQITYVIPKLKVRIVVRSNTRSRLTIKRRMEALQEALALDRDLQSRVDRFAREDRAIAEEKDQMLGPFPSAS